MNEKIEYKGYWWLPGNPDETVAGILTYIPEGKITLELIGTFDSKRIALDAFSDQKIENIIHGLTAESKEVTLINCFSSVSQNFSCPFPIINYDCQFLIIGKHMDNFKQKCFFKAFVKIPALSYWCPPSAIKKVHRLKLNDLESISISCGLGKIIAETRIDENTHLNIKEGVNYYGDHFSPKLEQFTYLEILKKQDASVGDFYSDIYMYEQFLSLATLQKVKCSEISLYDRSVYQDIKDGEKHYHPIQLIYVRRDVKEIPDFKRFNFLFDYSSIAQQYPQIIHKWYAEKSDIAPIREHLINGIRGNGVFTSVDFLIVIQAVEGFWWRFRDDNYRVKNKIPKRNKTLLSTIVEELIKEFASIEKIKKMDWDIETVVDSRHYYSHFMNKSKKPKTLDGLELLDLTSKLRILLICCLLNFVGFDYSLINKILNESNNNLLRR